MCHDGTHLSEHRFGHSIYQASFLHNKPKQQTKSTLNYSVIARIPEGKVSGMKWGPLCPTPYRRAGPRTGRDLQQIQQRALGSSPWVKVGKISCNFLKLNMNEWKQKSKCNTTGSSLLKPSSSKAVTAHVGNPQTRSRACCWCDSCLQAQNPFQVPPCSLSNRCCPNIKSERS